MQVNKKSMKSRQQILKEKRWIVWVVAAVAMTGAFLAIEPLMKASDSSLLQCTLRKTAQPYSKSLIEETTPIQLKSILHYATSRVTPQQTLAEISVTFNVLRSLEHLHRPINFLVFGLGHDSLMWASLNPRGNTLFLEEDPKWVETVLADAPELRAITVRYRTQLRQADALLDEYRSEPACSPARATLRGNEECKLALHDLPDEVYDTEWDLVMIDAPRGYYSVAPGRMGAIFSAGVMGRRREGLGVTHVFLHDVDRIVEKTYAEEFLCRKNLVEGVGRLWHFAIPPKGNGTLDDGDGDGDRFCEQVFE